MNLSIRKKKNLKTRGKPRFIALCIILTFSIFLVGNAGAQKPVEEVVATQGCAMAHCSQGLSDNSQLSVPLSGEVGVYELWHDKTVNGSFVGLGCVANGDTAVCSFRSSSANPVVIRAYDANGTPLWDSEDFSNNAFYSAPIIGPDGGVIAADETNIIRFDPDGNQVWNQPTSSGSQYRPNVTDDGHIILVPHGAPISAYDFDTGELVAQLRLEDSIRLRRRTLSGYFNSVNNAAIKGNRVYIATQFTYGRWPLRFGRLYALDLILDNGDYNFEIAWYYEFRASTGGSPTLGSDGEGNTVIHFDGNGVTPYSTKSPVAIAIRDLGNSAELLWDYPLPALPQASPSLDPRGGIWYFGFGDSELVRIGNNGVKIQEIDVNGIVNDFTKTFRPYSVMTISVDSNTGNPVGIVEASSTDNSINYIIAIDLKTEALLWQKEIGGGYSGGTSGQFAMLSNDSGEPVVVFTTREDGAWGLVVR